MTGASTAGTHVLAHYRAEFPVFQRHVYLNSCSLGALSVRSRSRVDAWLDQWNERGAAAWYDDWWGALDAVRAGYAGVIGASPAEIALHASVSTATAVLASALDYTRRPRVVTTALDFPTVAYQWLARRPLGVELVIVDSPDGVTVPVDAIADAVDEQTALVATSHVYYTSGAIQDIAAVAEAAHARGAFCYVDAYQSAGQVPLDVQTAGVDFLTSGGLKWLLGGPGIVFLFVRGDLVSSLHPTVTGWWAGAHQFDFNPRTIVWQNDARRFEQGTPALGAVYAQLGGLEIIREIGVPAIRRTVSALTEHLIGQARAAGRPPRVAAEPDRRSAIVMVPAADAAAEVRRLGAAGIVADARAGHVRLSPYFYNTFEDNVATIEALAGQG
jgi:selenocysteine lyase/cysteine desulfurase